MANSKAIEAGKAFLKLFIEDSGFRSGLDNSLRQLQSFGKSARTVGIALGLAGTTITAPFVLAAKQFATVGDSLDDMSQRTGVTVEMLSKLGFAADQTGSDIGTVEIGLRGMSKFLDDVAEGGQAALKVLDELGLSSADLRGKLPDEKMRLLLAAIARIEDPTKRMALAMQVFGKSGAQLIPLITNFEELAKKAERFGLVVSTEQAAAASRLSDAFDVLKKSISAVAFAIGGQMEPILTRASGILSDLAKSTQDFFRANQGLATAIAGTGLALTAAGGAIFAFGRFAEAAGFTMSFFTGGLAFLFSPLGVITALVVGLSLAFVDLGKAGSAAVSFLGKQFAPLLKMAQETFAEIADSLAAGDITNAANVMWAGLKLSWLEGTENLRVAFASFRNDAVSIFTDLVFDIQAVWSGAMAAIKSGFAEAKDFILDTADVIDSRFHKLLVLLNPGLFGNLDDLKDFLPDPRQDPSKLWNKQAERRAEADKRIVDRERERKATLQQIEAERKAERAAIEENRKTARSASDEQKKADIKAAAEAAAAAKAEFDKIRNSRSGTKPGGPLAQQLSTELGEFGASFDPRSTFSGRLAPQVFGAGGRNDTAKEILAEAKRHRAIFERIERQLGKRGVIIGGK